MVQDLLHQQQHKNLKSGLLDLRCSGCRARVLFNLHGFLEGFRVKGLGFRVLQILYTPGYNTETMS